MGRRAGVCCLLLMAVAATMGAQQPSSVTLTGCLSGQAGNYLLGAVPSGYLYRLTGNPGLLAGYNNRLIRVTGATTSAANSATTGSFQVQMVEQIADTCTTLLPPENTRNVRAVTGKTAERSVAIPTSSTESVQENTPPWQSPSGADTGAARPGPLAPPTWGQVGQAPQEGNQHAAAAERAEEYPSSTLGVNAMPDYSTPPQAQDSKKK